MWSGRFEGDGPLHIGNQKCWSYLSCVHSESRSAPSAEAALIRIRKSTRDVQSLRQTILRHYQAGSFPALGSGSRTTCLIAHAELAYQIYSVAARSHGFHTPPCEARVYSDKSHKNGRQAARQQCVESAASRCESVRVCNNPGCAIRMERMQMCSFCRQAYYCSRLCQVSAWKEHRKHCAPAVSICEPCEPTHL